jgi:hypothetical protein
MHLLLPYGLFLVRMSYTTFRSRQGTLQVTSGDDFRFALHPKRPRGRKETCLEQSGVVVDPKSLRLFWMGVHDLMLIQMAPSLTHDSSFGLVLPSFQIGSSFFLDRNPKKKLCISSSLPHDRLLNDPYQRAIIFCQRLAQLS